MDNITQIERLRYAKICTERTLFHDLINNCPWKSENLKQQGPLRVLLLLCFLFRSSPPKLFSKVAVLKFRKIPFETPAVDFCFGCTAWTFMSPKIKWISSMLSLEFLRSYFSKYLWLIAVTKSSYRKCSIKQAVLKNFAIFKEKTPVLESLFNKVAGLQACDFIKKRLQHRCFPVNVTKFLSMLVLTKSANGLFCVTLLYHLTLFSKFIQNYYLIFSFRYYVTYFA